MHPPDLAAEMANMDDRQLMIVGAYFVGCFAAVMAGRGHDDVEQACREFIQSMHKISGGVTPPPPKPPQH